MIAFGCIVEGQGDEQAVAGLIRRIAQHIDPTTPVQVGAVVRRPRSTLLREGHLEADVELVARRIGRTGAVLVLLDADDDCPAELGPMLLTRVRTAHVDLAVSVVVAKREFEAWFIAAAESLRGVRGLPDNLTAPPDPEAICGAKEWLSRSMAGPGGYSPTRHQASFAAQFDIEQARRADSFDKCYRDMQRLLATIQGRPA